MGQKGGKGAGGSSAKPRSAVKNQLRSILEVARVAEGTVRAARGSHCGQIESIRRVSGLVESWRDHRLTEMELARLGVRKVSSILLAATPELPEPVNQPVLLRAIGRHESENLHSDFLAALLRTSVSGDVASALFDRLFAIAANQRLEKRGECVHCSRETRLDAIDRTLEDTASGMRRIDLLATTRTRVLVIESKVWTGESESQTRDYANVVERSERRRRTAFLFLSPGGELPQDPRFRAMTFVRLATELAATCDPGPHLALQYRAELEDAFVGPRRRRLHRTRQQLSETTDS